MVDDVMLGVCVKTRKSVVRLAIEGWIQCTCFVRLTLDDLT